MIEIKYVCSNGEEYNLIGDKMKPTSGYFHSYEWNPNTTERKMGVTVNSFTKDPAVYEITLTVRGRVEERKEILDKITDAFERDVANLSPGRIYYGEYYTDCYIYKSSNEVSGENNSRTDCKVEIYCPYPFWCAEEKRSFFPISTEPKISSDYLDYPYDYSYDYTREKNGVQDWMIDHFQSSNFELIIYGPCTDPKITINNYPYQIFDTLSAGEYITVNSRTKTVTKNLGNGTMQNIFEKRAKDKSIFEPIPSGSLAVNWNGEFGFDFTVFKERSVPKWSQSTRIQKEKN